MSDSATSFAAVSLDEQLAAMERVGPLNNNRRSSPQRPQSVLYYRHDLDLPAVGQTRTAIQFQTNPSLRILVVDDEPVIRSLITGRLIESGYHMDAAKNGIVAWHTSPSALASSGAVSS